jgi:hypothetical protein
MATIETRTAVLEKIAESHDKRIGDMEDFQRNVVDRLDQKIQMDLASQISLERTLTRAVTSLDALSIAVKDAGEKADEAQTLVKKHETIGLTIMKVGTVLAVVLSAIWAVVKFVLQQ